MSKIRPVLLLLALGACLAVVAGCGDDVQPSAADKAAQQAVGRVGHQQRERGGPTACTG